MDWTLHEPREQEPLGGEPYDRWIAPTGSCMAEFHRAGRGYLIRFPGQVDVLVEPRGSEGYALSGWPVPGCDNATLDNQFHNAILPILGNHTGGLFLHGSAVKVDAADQSSGAIAFLGLSRGGKTTLAGSFAKAGHPFLTEDVIDLKRKGAQFWLQPKRAMLRLYADSARHLLSAEVCFEDEDSKQDLEAGVSLPFAQDPAPLRQIYVLGTNHSAALSIRKLSLQEALTALMPHAFILDVEDKQRLKGHFSRIADLAQHVPCYALDYPRVYAELPRVQRAILENLAHSQPRSEQGKPGQDHAAQR